MERIKVETVTKAFDKSAMLGHAILESIGADKAGDAVFKGMKGDGEDRYMEVEFKINGVEVHFSHFVNHIDKELDRMVKLTAKSIVEEQLDNMDNELSNLTRNLTKDIKRSIHKQIENKLGIEIREEEW